MNIEMQVKKQREYFNTGETLSVKFRKDALKILKKAIIANEIKISEALKQDLGKSQTESYMTEIGLVLSELSFAIKHIEKWTKIKRKPTPLSQFHSKSFIVSEPFGVSLIMSPWNYPFMLAMCPLVGSIAAGNCSVVKPSNYSSNTSKVIKEIITSVFDEKYVYVVEGGREQNQELLDQKFDFIFFTGGTIVGKQVYEKAAKHLTPVILELGGKSPCIIDKTANLNLAAKRLVFGKFVNCGQTCVAPDYVLVDKKIKDQFLPLVKKWIVKMYGDNPLNNPTYGHIINEKHYKRIVNLISMDKLAHGGKSEVKTNKIEPTVLDNITLEDNVMQEEIFGPVLPILTYKNLDEAVNIIKTFEKPLALYLFTTDKKVEKRILSSISYGGGCINDCIIHLATPHLGFGGVGGSGLGSYHGQLSFNAFSHQKSILKKYNYIDLPMRYQPYTKTNEKLIRMFLK